MSRIDTQPLAYALVVTDGAVLRTIHPAALGAAAADVERILRTYLFGEVTASPAEVAPQHATRTPAPQDIARSRGFTGDVCSTCGGFAMKRAGTCLTCQACGSTTGCG